MRRDTPRRAALALAFLVVTAPFAPWVAAQRPQQQQPALDEVVRQVIEHSNAFRHAQGLPPTQPEAALSTSAADFADFMARTDRYGHVADDRQPAERALAQGYEYCMVSENIAYQFSSLGFGTAELARGFVQGWIDSPAHRRNLLSPEATDTGVAVARSERSGRYYAVQMFGRPAAMRIRFSVSNQSASPLQYVLDDQRFDLARGATRWHERCEPPTLSVALPGRSEPVALKPDDGAHYRFEPMGREVRLIRR
jgi:uncharacterized protein YkwD